MSIDLARALVLTEVVPWGGVAQALFVSTTRGVPFIRALLDADALSLDRLEEELARADAPVAANVTPDVALLERLPRGLCSRLLAVPIARDASGQVDVAFADARDQHAVRELSHHLGASVRVLRAPFAKIEEAVRRLPTGARREQEMMESTLVSVRAPDGIPEPSSDRNGRPVTARSVQFVEAPSAARSPVTPIVNSEPPPASVSPSDPPLPLVRRATDSPIPLVRRAEEQPVLELRSPYSRAPAPARVESAAAASIRGAHSRDEILRLLLEGVSEVAKRVVLFAVRKDGFSGLLASPTMGDEARIRNVRVPPQGPSIFFNVASAGTYTGPLYSVEAHKPLFALLPSVSDVVGVAAVRLRGRALVLVLAEGMKNPPQDMRLVEELVRSAGDAFARVLAAKGE